VQEITLECNPGDVTLDKLSSYLDSGVNRLSIGVQSFSDSLLRLLGRRHTSSDAIRSYKLAIESGFENVSIDLMYGLPNQTIQDWTTTLEIARGMEPAHVSMYCLTLEDGTPMKKQVQIGTLPPPDADLAADMYMMCDETFSHPDYRHYEISNWAKPGNESVHNLTYWRNESFLGIGPGSHSYINGQRFWNIKPPREYITRLKTSHKEPTQSPVPNIPVVDEVEAIDRKMEIAETMMMGLRLDTGICIDQFSARFSDTPAKHFGSIISELESTGLVEQSSDFIKLTAKGRLLGNEVFSRFFL
jgi:oxygen-independent coproporphyrinogen-3 oxidase